MKLERGKSKSQKYDFWFSGHIVIKKNFLHLSTKYFEKIYFFSRLVNCFNILKFHKNCPKMSFQIKFWVKHDSVWMPWQKKNEEDRICFLKFWKWVSKKKKQLVNTMIYMQNTYVSKEEMAGIVIRWNIFNFLKVLILLYGVITNS